MPPWASGAIGVAPWVAVAIVAIVVGGMVLGKILEVIKIWIMRSAKSPMVAYESKGEQWVWVVPRHNDAQPPGVEPSAKLQLRSVEEPGSDFDPSARSG